VLDGPNKNTGEGTIRFISPTVDAATRLAEVHLVFPNADGKLRSGIAGTLMVPTTATP
jgi:multidrug efflux pump subunit AcrA (membrane-fusion protein)